MKKLTEKRKDLLKRTLFVLKALGYKNDGDLKSLSPKELERFMAAASGVGVRGKIVEVVKNSIIDDCKNLSDIELQTLVNTTMPAAQAESTIRDKSVRALNEIALDVVVEKAYTRIGEAEISAVSNGGKPDYKGVVALLSELDSHSLELVYGLANQYLEESKRLEQSASFAEIEGHIEIINEVKENFNSRYGILTQIAQVMKNKNNELNQ